MHPSPRSAFTLIELLVVIAVIAILAVVVVLVLNPAELLRQSRDSNRASDMATLNNTLGIYSTDQSGTSGFSLGSSSVVYVSIPDPTAPIAGNQCQGLGLITLPATYTYHCAASSTFRNVNGTGWIPVNLASTTTGAPLGALPVDPMNTSSSRFYYTYITNGTNYEVTSVMESQKYGVGGSNDVISSDGGPLASVYEKGSKLGLEPLDYGDSSLVGYWPLNEGTSSIAYDDSGNGNYGRGRGLWEISGVLTQRWDRIRGTLMGVRIISIPVLAVCRWAVVLEAFLPGCTSHCQYVGVIHRYIHMGLKH